MSVITDKVALCQTCHQARHLLNMLSGSRRCEAINEMINNHDGYQLDNGILKKKSGNEWLPIGKVTGVGCGEVKSFWMDDLGITSFYLKNDGTLYATGYNFEGDLGLGDNNNRNVFTQVPITDVREVFPLSSLTFILKNDGTLWSTGVNDSGQLGVGDTTYRNEFTEVIMPNELHITIDSKIEIKTLERYHSFLIHNDKDAYWIPFSGNGTFEKVLINNVQRFIPLKWSKSIFFYTTDDKLYACGKNDYGQLGIGTFDEIITPIEVTYFPNTKDIKKIDYSGNSSYILKNDGTLHVVGKNNYGQLGLDDTDDRPSWVQALTNVVDLFIIQESAYALRDDGEVWVTGVNGNHQLGHTNNTHKFSYSGISNVAKILEDFINDSRLFLKNNGTIWAIGENGRGELGIGNTDDQSDFKQVHLPEPYASSPIPVIVTNRMYFSNSGNLYITGYMSDFEGSDLYTPGVGFEIKANSFRKMILPFNNSDVKEYIFTVYTYIFKLYDGRVFGCNAFPFGQIGLGPDHDVNESVYNVVELPMIDRREEVSDNVYNIDLEL